MGKSHKMNVITAFTPSFTASCEILHELKEVSKLTVFMKQFSFPDLLGDI